MIMTVGNLTYPGEFSFMVMNKTGNQIVRELVTKYRMPKYQLAKRLGVSTTCVYDWLIGKYFSEERLDDLQKVLIQWKEEKGYCLFDNDDKD